MYSLYEKEMSLISIINFKKGKDIIGKKLMVRLFFRVI